GHGYAEKVIDRIEAERYSATQKQVFAKRVAADRCQGESREGNLGTRVCKSAEFEREITAFIRLVGNVLGLDYLRRRQKT
ncbi:hypothetical protein AABQ75_09015, partial [Campylobacter jejuni]